MCTFMSNPCRDTARKPPPCRNRENRKTVKNARTPESSRVTGTASFFLGKEKEGGGGGIDDLQL